MSNAKTFRPHYIFLAQQPMFNANFIGHMVTMCENIRDKAIKCGQDNHAEGIHTVNVGKKPTKKQRKEKAEAGEDVTEVMSKYRAKWTDNEKGQNFLGGFPGPMAVKLKQHRAQIQLFWEPDGDKAQEELEKLDATFVDYLKIVQEKAEIMGDDPEENARKKRKSLNGGVVDEVVEKPEALTDWGNAFSDDDYDDDDSDSGEQQSGML